MNQTLRVGLIGEPAGWHLNGLIDVCATHPEVAEVAIADPTGQIHQKFRPLTGSSPDANWHAGPHEPGSGPLPGWVPLGADTGMLRSRINGDLCSPNRKT